MEERALRVRSRLQTRIALLVTLLLILSTLALTYVATDRLGREKRRGVHLTSDAIALFIGNLMVARLVSNQARDPGMLEKFVDTAVRLYRDVAFITVLDADGAVEYGRLNPAVISTADAEEELAHIAQYAAGGAVPPGISAVTLVIAGPPESDGPAPELGRVRVGVSLRSMAARIRQVTYQSLAIAGLILAVGVLASFLLGNRISKPLRELAHAMEAVNRGDLDQSIVLDAGDEVGLLAERFNDMTEGLREREKARENFARYVSPQLVEQVMKDPDSVVLHGERRDVTILFSDIRGFTRLSDQAAPEDLVFMLNEYFERMVNVVFRYDGYLNKFMGDAIMAVFGAPMPVPDHPWRAVACAAEMFNELHVLNRKRKERGEAKIEIGIGIASGDVVVGNIGSLKKLEYTAIGDVVNLAQRIESTSKTVDHGIPLLISAATYSAIMDRVEIEALQPVLIKGKTVPIQIYQVTGIKELA